MHGGVEAVDERFLLPLGVHRLPVPVPWVEAGGPVNAWAIEDPDGRWTLFDAGVGTADGVAALRGEAAARGIDLRRLSRIVVSHGHVDHFGNAQQLSEESGAPVLVHEADEAKVRGEARFAALIARHRGYFLRALGVPAEILDAMQAAAEASRERPRYLEPHRLRPLREGDVLRFRHFEAEVLHTPGHTPGLVCLHAPGPRLLFADDHLLERVSPNPLLDLAQGEGPTKFRALARYLDSARRVQALELAAVLPGHGPSFRGHRALLDGLFAFYLRRQEKLLGHLRAAPATAFECLPVLFPRREPGRLLLMLSEVLGHLEVLEDRGLAAAREAGGVVRYAEA